MNEVLPKEIADRIVSIEKAIQTKELQRFDYQLLTAGKLNYFEARLVLSGEDSILPLFQISQSVR
ncbi:hypothetical protein ACT9XH_00015 [Methanococcoides methylutens]|uniref:hypothetical protein n=1 Tax=Methanococcoides methylutens TaxID=2226 RepID=UPI004044F8E9